MAVPNTPTNTSPLNGDTDLSLTPTLKSSAFSGDGAHTGSQWQITTTSGNYSSPVYDSGDDATNLVSIDVPAGNLSNAITYYWHVRHENAAGWSNYSTETAFTTRSANDENLATAQAISPIIPYVTVHYYDGAAWQDLSADVREIKHNQDPYESDCTIRLYNGDGAYDSLDLRGKKLRIGYGLTYLGSNYVKYKPYLWCSAQALVSASVPDGMADYIVYGEGAWNKLRRWLALRDSPDDDIKDYFFNQDVVEYQNKTIKEIISVVCATAGVTLGTSISEDTIVDSFEPIINLYAGTNGQEAVVYLLKTFTDCELIAVDDELQLKYPQSGDAVDYTYYSDQAHYFWKGSKSSVLPIPLKVTVKSGAYIGTYASIDPVWDSSMGSLLLDYDGYEVIVSDANCITIATARVNRAIREATVGKVVVPMDCLRGLSDKVTITDTRDGTSGTGRVGGLYAHYLPEKAVYTLEVRLGGLQRRVAENIQDIVNDLALGGGISGNLIKQHTIPPEAVRLSMQPYSSDIIFLSGDNANVNKHNAVHWAAGHIHFADGTTQNINAGEITGLGDGVTRYIYFIVGNNSLQHTSEYVSVVSEKTRLLVTVIVSSDPKQEIGILLNQNTSGNFISDLMAPGAIKSDTLADFAVAVKKTNLQFHQIY